MNYSFPRLMSLLLVASVTCLFGHAALASDSTAKTIAPNAKPADMKKPLQVYILLGQSNMVGMADIGSRPFRWTNSDFKNKVMSIYPGAYDPKADYDKMKPIKTEKITFDKHSGFERYKGDQKVTYVLRGTLAARHSGVYKLWAGYGDASYNVMEVGGKEVYRKDPGSGKMTRTSVKLTAGQPVPFKVTYFNEHAYPQGYWVREDLPGTLTSAVKIHGKFPYLLSKDGNWKSCNSVYYYDARTRHGSPLSPESNGNRGRFGPELGFGFVLGTVEDAPILVMKSCIGNRSLAWDLLPPGSKEFTYNGETYAGYHEAPNHWPTGQKPADPEKNFKTHHGWYAGLQYDTDIGNAKAALANLSKIDPQYHGQGYKIAGYFFWQGEKDSLSDADAVSYEHHMVDFIKAVRKDFNTPKAPFVIATCGFYGSKMNGDFLKVWQAQMDVGNPQKYPEFAGNVAVVNTRKYWPVQSQSPNQSQFYHYYHNAITYVHVGVDCGWAMANLLGEKAN